MTRRKVGIFTIFVVLPVVVGLFRLPFFRASSCCERSQVVFFLVSLPRSLVSLQVRLEVGRCLVNVLSIIAVDSSRRVREFAIDLELISPNLSKIHEVTVLFQSRSVVLGSESIFLFELFTDQNFFISESEWEVVNNFLFSRFVILGSRSTVILGRGRFGFVGSRLGIIGSRLRVVGSRLRIIGSRLGIIGGSRLRIVGSRLGIIGSRLGGIGSRLRVIGSRLGSIGSRLSAVGGCCVVSSVGFKVNAGDQCDQQGCKYKISHQDILVNTYNLISDLNSNQIFITHISKKLHHLESLPIHLQFSLSTQTENSW